MITRLVLLVLLLLTFTGMACTATEEAEDSAKVEAVQAADEPSGEVSTETVEITDKCKLIAYYFYGAKRCVTCKKIEAYTKEAIETGFADKLESGELVWMPVNLDEGDNDHYRVDYNLYTKSVVLSKRDKGAETEWKNLEKIWQLVRGDKEEYVKYIQDEVKGMLQES